MNRIKWELKRNSILWEKFITGDDKAYTELYNLNVNHLFRYGLHFTPSHETIKDCIQDVFTYVYSHRKRHHEIKNVRFYLLICFKNNLYKYFKKETEYFHIDTLEPVFSLDYAPDKQIIEEEEICEREKSTHLILSVLTPRQKEVMYYRFSLGLSYEEICEIMKMNYQSVRNLLHRSILKVREVYPDYNALQKYF